MTGRVRLEQDNLPQGGHKARGVVLRRKEGSASASKSFELLLFLSAHGAIWVSAPGAGGSKNRFGGGSEPMMWGDFELYQSPRRLYLKSVDVREDFLRVRSSKRLLQTALGWFGEVSRRLPQGVENDALLSLLYACMKHLANGASPQLTGIRFAWRWANLWGVAPSLEFCAACGKDLLRGNAGGSFFPGPEGICCAACGTSRGARLQIDDATHGALYRAACLPRDDFFRMAAGEEPLDAVIWRDVLDWLYAFLA